jgi:hypothetical protein
MGIARTAARALVPVGLRIAPHVGSGLVRELLVRAIDGVGPFRSAAAAAEAQLAEAGGDRPAAVSGLIDRHVRAAGVSGFVTNIGGLVTLAVAIPANVAGLALLQCHLAATIAHLQGYDLDDPRVRNAVLACLLGPNLVKELVRSGDLPSGPMGLATSPVHDPALDTSIAQAVTTELFGRVGGRRMVTSAARRVPLLGGGVGAVGDGLATYRVGRYAERELRARPRGVPAPVTVT